MEKAGVNKSTAYKNLIRKVSSTSGYHIYEVEDVLNHFIGHIQHLLAEGNDVKISGIGTISVTTMKDVTRVLNDEEICYDAYRLSISMDVPMRRFMQENAGGKSSTK